MPVRFFLPTEDIGLKRSKFSFLGILKEGVKDCQKKRKELREVRVPTEYLGERMVQAKIIRVNLQDWNFAEFWKYSGKELLET
jgi:hypothetical protein